MEDLLMREKKDKRFMLPHWPLFKFAWGIIVRIADAIKFTLMGPDKPVVLKIVNSEPPKREEKTTDKNRKSKAEPKEELSKEDKIKQILEKTNIVSQFKNLMSGIKGKEEKEADSLRNKFFEYVQKNNQRINSLKEIISKTDKVKLSKEEIEWGKDTSNIPSAAKEIEEAIQSEKKLTDTEISRLLIAYVDLKAKGLQPEVLKELKLANISPQKIEYRSYMDKKENLEKCIESAKAKLDDFMKHVGPGKEITASDKKMIDALEAFVGKSDISYENAQKIWGKGCFDNKFSRIVTEQAKTEDKTETKENVSKEEKGYGSKNTNEEKKDKSTEETHTEAKDDLHELKNGDLFIVRANNRNHVCIYHNNEQDNVISYIALKGRDIEKVPKYNSRRDKDKFLSSISKDILKTNEKKVSPIKYLNININEINRDFPLEKLGKMVGITSLEENGKDIGEEQKQLEIDLNEIKQHYKIAVEVINNNSNIEDINFNKIKTIESDIVQNSLGENALVNRLNQIAELYDQQKNYEEQIGDDLNNKSLDNHSGKIVIDNPGQDAEIPELSEFQRIVEEHSYTNADGEKIVDEEGVERECKEKGINMEPWNEGLDQEQQSGFDPGAIEECHEEHEDNEEIQDEER